MKRRLTLGIAVTLGAALVMCGPEDAAAGRPGRLPWHRNGSRRGDGGVVDFSLLHILRKDTFANLVATGAAVPSVTFTRDSGVYCTNDAGVLTLLATNLPCVENDGLRVEPVATNLSIRSSEFGSWSQFATTTTSDFLTGPDGTVSADRVVADNTSSLHAVFHSTAGAVTAVRTYSVYMHNGTRATGGGAADWLRISGGSVVPDGIFDQELNLPSTTSTGLTLPRNWMQAAANGFYRDAIVMTDIPSAFNLYMGRSAFETQAAFTDGGTDFVLWGGQLESGCYPTSPIATGAAAATRALVTATATNPLVDADTTWVLRATVAPDMDEWDTRCVAAGILQLGTTQAAANTASVWADSSGYLNFSVAASDAGTKTWTSQYILLPGSRVIRALNTAGTLSVTVDGVAVDGGVSGSGTGIITTQPSTMYLGSLGAVTQLGGRISDVCVGNVPAACPASEAIPAPAYTANTFFAMGDSITNGPGVTSWPAVLDSNLPASWVITNAAVGSTSTQANVLVWRATGADAGTQYVSIMSGINDTIVAGRTEFDWWKLKRIILNETSMQGRTPVLLDETPWKGDGGAPWAPTAQTMYAAIQTRERAWCAATGQLCHDAYADMGGGDGGDPQVLLETYNLGVDGVHLSQTGHNRIAGKVQTLLGY